MWWRKRDVIRPDKRALFVGEEMHLGKLFQRRLTGKGYEVSTATSTYEAVELIQSRSFEVVFVDELLPGSHNLSEQIRDIPGAERTKVMILPRVFANPFQPPSSPLPGPPGVVAIATERFRESLRKLGL